MRSKNFYTIVIVMASLTVLVSIALEAQQKAAQDRYTVKALNGVSFSEFKATTNGRMSPSVGPILRSRLC